MRFFLHFSKNYCTFAPQRSINHHCRWLRQREKAETYYLLTAFIDACFDGLETSQLSNTSVQNNATIDVCVLVYTTLAFCMGVLYTYFGVGSVLLVSD